MRVQNTRAEDSSISSYEALERGPAPTFRTSSSVYSNKKWRSFSVDAKRARQWRLQKWCLFFRKPDKVPRYCAMPTMGRNSSTEKFLRGAGLMAFAHILGGLTVDRPAPILWGL